MEIMQLPTCVSLFFGSRSLPVDGFQKDRSSLKDIVFLIANRGGDMTATGVGQ